MCREAGRLARLTVVCGLLLTLRPAPAAAQARAARAKVLATEAYDLFDQGRYLDAADKLHEAYELQPFWEHRWNEARALEQGGALVRAHAAYTSLRGAEDLPPERREQVLAKIVELAPQLVGGAALTCEAPGATFELDGPGGAVRGALPWHQERMRVGDYEVHVRHPAYQPSTVRIQIEPGLVARRHVVLTSLQPRAAQADPAPAAGDADRWWSRAAWGGTAAAGLLVVSAGALWWSSSRLEADAGDLDESARAQGDPDKLREAERLDRRWVLRRNVAVGCLAAAGVAAAVAATGFLVQPANEAPGPRIVVAPGPNGLGFALSGRF